MSSVTTITISTSPPILVTDATPITKKRKVDELSDGDVETKEKEVKMTETKREESVETKQNEKKDEENNNKKPKIQKELVSVEDFITHLNQLPTNTMIVLPTTLSQLSLSQGLVKSSLKTLAEDEVAASNFVIPTPLFDLCNLVATSDYSEAQDLNEKVMKNIAIETAKMMLRGDKNLFAFVEALLNLLELNKYEIIEEKDSNLSFILKNVYINRYECVDQNGRVGSTYGRDDAKFDCPKITNGITISTTKKDNERAIYINSQGKVCQGEKRKFIRNHPLHSTGIIPVVCGTQIMRSVCTSLSELRKIVALLKK
jgi:hypothetical protein